MEINAIAAIILLGGFLGGKLFAKLGLPSLIGMVLVGLLLGNTGLNWVSLEQVEALSSLRAIAVMVILIRAGLGLDQDKLRQQGSVAIRLGFLPGLCEMVVVAIVAIYWLKFDGLTGLLLGSIIGAESPAVIVPAMLKLKTQGWGVKKGIPDAILTGSALSDAVLLLIFSLLLTVLGDRSTDLTWMNLARLPLQAALQITAGLMMGWGAAKLLIYVLTVKKLTNKPLETTLIIATIALGLILIAERSPFFSGYLAVMSLGFFLTRLDPPLARHLRQHFANLWAIAAIFLFVLLGANIQLQTLQSTWLQGLGLLAISLIIGRGLGWWLATLGSNWTTREKLFLLPSNSAKATVQAAIGAIPLTLGLDHGDVILAIAALSILITAPLGAWAIPFTAPKLLQKNPVDPTKVLTTNTTKFLAAIDNSDVAIAVLKQTADLARRTNGTIIVLHINEEPTHPHITVLQGHIKQHLADITTQWQTDRGAIAEAIIENARTQQVTAIVIGKKGKGQRLLMGSVTQAVLETSPIPVTVVAAPKTK